jgi:pyridoxamine 5'-phosphate oxidase
MSEFLENLRNDHQDFDSGNLLDYFPENPLELFELWFKDALEHKEPETNALVLSTIDITENKPSSRIVYLKELINSEFVFYTNYYSQKGKELAQNANACMLFFWPGLQRQIRIEGLVTMIDEAISDAYFASRPRESQIGAWSSYQSDKLSERIELENRFIELSESFGGEIPRPPHWGGYALKPNLIEFWQGRPSRLHDRIVYEISENDWVIYRKNP